MIFRVSELWGEFRSRPNSTTGRIGRGRGGTWGLMDAAPPGFCKFCKFAGCGHWSVA